MYVPTKWTCWLNNQAQPTDSIMYFMHLCMYLCVYQDFFLVAEDQGVKRTTIERGIKQLKAVITLYRETTGGWGGAASEARGGLRAAYLFLAVDGLKLFRRQLS